MAYGLMTDLMQMAWTIDRVLFAEVASLLCLLAALRLRRFVRGRWIARRAKAASVPQQMPQREVIRRDPVEPVAAPRAAAPRPQALEHPTASSHAPPLAPSVMSALRAGPEPKPARLLALDAAPAAAVPPAAEAVPTPAPVVARRRPKPAREAEDTILSPTTLLARAHDHLAAGAQEEAATQLRLCVRLAGKLKETTIEALARLELGDLSRASGDLTTACEHWQMARALFTDMKLAQEALAAERRMERAGCPTDWVLTQF